MRLLISRSTLSLFPRFARSWCVVVLLAVLGAWHALPCRAIEWQVVLEHSQPGPDGQPIKNLEVLRIADRSFYTLLDGTLRAYDFERMTYSEIRSAAKVAEYPLIAIADSRDRRFSHELDTHHALRDAQITGFDPEVELFYSEATHQMTSSLLGVGAIKQEPDGRGGTRVLLKGRFVASFSPSGSRLDGNGLILFERYLLYTHTIHPRLRRDMLEGGTLPSEITYRVREGKDTFERKLRLVSVETVADTLYHQELRAMAVPFSTHPLDAAMHTVRHDRDAAEKRPTPLEYGQAFEANMERGFYVDAFLCALEFYYESGAGLGTSLARLEPQLNTQENLAALASSLNLSTEEDALRGLRILETMPRNSSTRPHMLDILRANALFWVGRYLDAEKHFLAALSRNPWLAGVYKELADLYTRSERFDRAWRCHALALLLAPEHPLLKHQREREAYLLEKYPGYF